MLERCKYNNLWDNGKEKKWKIFKELLKSISYRHSTIFYYTTKVCSIYTLSEKAVQIYMMIAWYVA